MSSVQLDTIGRYQTPESVELRLALAGPVVRGLAWLLDFAIRAIGYMVIVMVLSSFGGLGAAVILIGLFVIEWFYPVLFEVLTGSTPGKKVLNLQVVHDDGTPVSWSSSLIRNLLRPVDFLPLFNVTGLICAILSSKFKRLGDLAAGTVVVYSDTLERDFSIADYPPAPPPVPLKQEEQRLILDYCARAGDISGERRHELALLLGELIDRDIPENRLLAYGNWFLRGNTAHESKPL